MAITVPVCLALGIAGPGLWPLSLVVVGAAAVAIGIDGMRAPRAEDLEITLDVPGAIYIGTAGTMRTVVATPDAGYTLAADIAYDTNPLLRRLDTLRVDLKPASDNSIEAPLRPRRRGVAEVFRVWLRWGGPWQLMSRTKVAWVGAEIPVIPDIGAVRDTALRFAAREGAAGARPDAGRGEGTAFHALREWVPGLDPRSIDWKHSARHRQLVAKEFQAERNHQIMLAIDTGHLMREPLQGIPRLDLAINAGLMLAFMCLRGGDRVGLFAFDSQVRRTLEPVSGRTAFGRLQRAAADLAYNTEETNFTLGLTQLTSQLHHRSLIVVMTEFIDTVTAELMVDNLSRTAGRHLVLFVTFRDSELEALADIPPDGEADMARAVIADGFLHDRQVVMRKLRRLGVLCLEAPGRTVGPELINRYLAIKRMELI